MTVHDEPTPAAAGGTIRDRVVELRRVRAKDLLAHPRNWRTHPSAQRSALRTVLSEIGYADALLARESETGELQLIDGHLRRDLTPEQEVPVLVLDVTEEEALILLATIDPLASMAGTSTETLQALLADAPLSSTELLEHLQRAYLELPTDRAGRTSPDSLPDPGAARTKPGDLWILGEHRLLCGDATIPNDVARVMNGEHAALFATDPPYGVNYTGKRPSRSRDPSRTRDAGKDWSDSYRDVGAGKDWSETFHDPSDGWPAFLIAFTEAALPHLTPSAAWYLWHAHRWTGAIHDLWHRLGVLPHQEIVWVKPAAMFSTAYFNWRHEPCLFGWREGHRPDWVDQNLGAHTTSVWEITYDGGLHKQQAEHPTQKPVELFALPMRIHTHPGDLCYEPFAGSGSQIIAAEMTGRRCYALEISPVFCDVIARRWEAFTGSSAQLITTDNAAL